MYIYIPITPNSQCTVLFAFFPGNIDVLPSRIIDQPIPLHLLLSVVLVH